jgi:hypothetical protein
VANITADSSLARTERWHVGWLYGRNRDLALVLLPIALTIASAVLMTSRAEGSHEDLVLRSGTMWIAQYIFGSTSHIALTFLLLGARRDLVHSTPKQARILRFGSAAVFSVMFGLYWLGMRTFPGATPFVMAVTVVVAQHHLLSQVKGYWSLYGLRALRDGVAIITSKERRLQQLYVPLALLAVMIRVLFVPLIDEPDSPPFVAVLKGEPAILPFSVTYALLAGWCVYSALVLREVTRAPVRHTARVLYVFVHLAAVALMLVSMRLGIVMKSALHGLEYYFITERMMRPLPSDLASRIRKAAVVPVMALSMLPLFILGVARNPWWPTETAGTVIEILLLVLSAATMTHYFVDAFLFRFRIPEVREVALRRLGFKS